MAQSSLDKTGFPACPFSEKGSIGGEVIFIPSDEYGMSQPISLNIRLLLWPALVMVMQLGQLSTAQAQYTCFPNECRLPECYCAGVVPPEGLSREETPQFILVTFDDAVTSFSESFVDAVFAGITNPDGRIAPRTYFVTQQYSNPELIRSLYDQGHEIANHTATHETGLQTDRGAWLQQMTALQDFLIYEAGIPADQVAGFRAPYLASNEPMWEALDELGYLYDSSVTEKPNDPVVVSKGIDAYVWPHTLDYGHGLTCGPESCPTTRVSGLWTIPMWVLYTEEGIQQAVMDPATSSDSLFQNLLVHNFQRHYQGNRAPLGLYLHAGQLWNPDRQKKLRSFLIEKLALPDVWMITMRGLIEWMQNPVPSEQMEAWFAAGCYRDSCVSGTNTSSIGDWSSLPLHDVLYPNYPNPFTQETTFRFDITETTEVQLVVYDILGKLVAVPVSGLYSPGRYLIPWDADGLASGMYVYRWVAGAFHDTRQLLLLK